MRILISISILTFLITHTLEAQVLDVAPTGRQNILPVEGGGVQMKIDSITPLNNLIEKLDSNWKFLETGKGYWIGYTDDMFSIAARGDSAIPELMEFFKTSRTTNGKIGVIYTLHLIGIERKIVGRFYEKFLNPKARFALLKLLQESEYTYPIVKLLMRDPWQSDIPIFFNALLYKRDSEDWWPIINSLNRYKMAGLPISNFVEDSIMTLKVEINNRSENSLDPFSHFSSQIKKALKEFESKYPDRIKVEQELFTEELSKNYSTDLPSYLSIRNFLDRLGLEISPFGYTRIACKIQYYTQSGELNFCTIKTARDRLINWWAQLSPSEKNNFK